MYYIFLILLIIILIYFIINNKQMNKFDNKKDFYIKWINDRNDLVNLYGKEYLINLTSPVFSYISKLPDDIIKYPNYINANPIKLTLNKGESLFIPAGWWHYITSYDRNIAINTWYIPYYDDVTNKTWRNNINNIDKINTINQKDINNIIFLEYVKKSKPLIIKNLYNWNALHKWDNNYLINKIGKMPIYYHKFANSNFWNNEWRTSNQNELYDDTFDNFINRATTDKNYYYYLARNYDIAKLLKDDYTNFNFTSDLKYGLSNIWMNFGSINCPLHYDKFDNILSQIDGYKEILLFPPSDDKNLYLSTNFI